MKTSLAALVAVLCLACVPEAYCADAKVQLQGLVAKVEAKLQAGKASEADLAPELKEFDALLAEHKSEKTDQIAGILLMKAMLYAQVLDNNEKATAEFRRLKAEFPDTEPGKQADSIVDFVTKQAAAIKIQSALKIGTAFPDFKVNDSQGKPLSVSGHKGKIVLVDFWATWCGPCVQELPNMIRLYQEYHDKGFDIIGISLDDDRVRFNSFIRDAGMTWPQYFDGKGLENTLARSYGIATLPASYLLDRDGKIIGRGLRGSMLSSAVIAAVEAR